MFFKTYNNDNKYKTDDIISNLIGNKYILNNNKKRDINCKLNMKYMYLPYMESNNY